MHFPSTAASGIDSTAESLLRSEASETPRPAVRTLNADPPTGDEEPSQTQQLTIFREQSKQQGDYDVSAGTKSQCIIATILG